MRLSSKRLDAIISALNFCLADDWQQDCHSQDQETYEEALDWACGEQRKREERRNGR